MMDYWKEYLKMLLTALLAISYYMITDKYPDLPMTEEKFVEVFLWVFETFVFTKIGYKLYLVKINLIAKQEIFKYKGFLLW